MSILFLACLLAICLPILSVQLPRLLPHFHTPRSINTAENRSTLPERAPPLRRRLRQGRAAPTPRSAAQRGRRKATDGADSGARESPEEETGSEEIHIQPQTGLLKVEGKGKGRADGMEPGRKPWDPPFPRKRERGVGSGWFVTPPTPPKKTGRELEEKGVARRLFPLDADGDYTYDQQSNHGILESDPEATPRPTPAPTPLSGMQDHVHIDYAEPVSAQRKRRSKPGAMSVVWICVSMLAVLILILAFAILIAHCLAWFLVYKTEARLGEARRGIMQGGEMRLCLCAT